MKNILSLLLLLISVSLWSSAASADEILAKAADKINSAKSMTVKFDGSASGTLTVSGKMFSMVAGGFGIWYDGSDMWTYSNKAGETSLTSPTPSELLETNPMEIIKNYKTAFTAAKASQTGNRCTITLTPKDKNNTVRMATVIINTSSWLPESIDLILQNDNRMTLNVTSATFGGALTADHFVYPSSKYPGIEVVDLR